MRASLKTSFFAFALSSALAGVAAPAFADSYYSGIDPHNPPGTQSRGQMLFPRLTSPTPSDVDPTATGSIDGQQVTPSGTYQQRYDAGEGDYYRGIVPPTR
ncbi:MAG TPA: hypothetical protein VD840_10430 [Sinorhizobium sp.]|nr:hypothetical protein [Sinorhizobium sp.]